MHIRCIGFVNICCHWKSSEPLLLAASTDGHVCHVCCLTCIVSCPCLHAFLTCRSCMQLPTPIGPLLMALWQTHLSTVPSHICQQCRHTSVNSAVTHLSTVPSHICQQPRHTSVNSPVTFNISQLSYDGDGDVVVLKQVGKPLHGKKSCSTALSSHTRLFLNCLTC